MKIFNERAKSIPSRTKQRRIPMFAASLRADSATTSNDDFPELQETPEWLKTQSNNTKKVVIGKTAEIAGKKPINFQEMKSVSDRDPIRSPSAKATYPNAIFDVVKDPINVTTLREKSYPLSFGVDFEDGNEAAIIDVDQYDRDDDDDEDSKDENIEDLISGLEDELQKLQRDYNFNFKSNNKEEEDMSVGYADLFLRSPPDDRILKQYFPSMYKTTEEIFTKAASRVSVPTTSSNDVLEDVQRRMGTLTDNLDWAKSSRRNQELNSILDTFKVDPGNVALKLEIKKLVDDCISSLECEVKDAVQKQLENDKKKNVFQNNLLRENVMKSKEQVSRSCRKNLFKKENPKPKENKEAKSVTSKKVFNYLKSGRSTQQALTNKTKSGKTKVEAANTAFDKVPSLWDEASHGYLYGNLLNLNKRVTGLNPYPHLRNSLPAKLTPWPPKSLLKNNSVKQVQSSVLPGRNVTRLDSSKQTIPNKKSNRDENILRAKLMKVQYKKSDVGTVIQNENLKKGNTKSDRFVGRVVKSAPNARASNLKIEIDKRKIGRDIGTEVNSVKNNQIDLSPKNSAVKKQVRFQATPRPIPIPKWSDVSPQKELVDDLNDLDDLKVAGTKINELTLQTDDENNLIGDITANSVIIDAEKNPFLSKVLFNHQTGSAHVINPKAKNENNLIGDISTNAVTIDAKKNPFLSKIVRNHQTERANVTNQKLEVFGNDFGAAGDHPGNEFEKPSYERKQIIHTGGGDAEFILNNSDDLQKKAALNNTSESSNFDDAESLGGASNTSKKHHSTPEALDHGEFNRTEGNNADEELNVSQMSSISSINEEESKKSIEEIEEDLSTNINTSSMVHSEADKLSNIEPESDELIESEKAEIGDMLILPGFSPPLIESQHQSQAHRRHKNTKRKIPSCLSGGTGAANLKFRWQSSNELVLKTAQDWVEKELVARTLSLRLSQNDKLNERRIAGDGNSAESREMPFDNQLLQSLVEEILKEKTFELLKQTSGRNENSINADVHLQTSENTEMFVNEEITLETPQPTPPVSPTSSYSESFERSEENALEIVSTPSPSATEDVKKERLTGGGRNYKDVDSAQPPFAAYTDQVPTPSSSPSHSEHTELDQISEPLPSSQTPVATNLPLAPFALHRVPEEAQIFVDEMTQTDPVEQEQEVPFSLPVIPPLPAASSIYPPEKSSTVVEKATSTPSSPSSPDATTSTSMPSSLSEGEWVNLKPWQRITPFFRYTSQIPSWNNAVGLDNSLQNVEDLEQDPVSEGEILIPFSAWKSNLIAAALASGFQVDEASQFSTTNITEPGPSTQPSIFFNRPESPGELPVQASGVFALPSASVTAVEALVEDEDRHELERRFSTCSVQTASDSLNEDNPPTRIPVQHIIVEDTTSILNEEEVLLNALQHVFLPAEPGLVLPVTQSMDPVLRRQYLERLVSEGEIRASFPLSPNRASNPDNLRSWGRSLVNAMIKKAISAPGLNAHRKWEDSKSIQRLSTIIASRNTSRSSQTQTDFPISLADEVKASTLDDEPPLVKKNVEMTEVPTTSTAPIVSFKEFPFDPQEKNLGTIPKVKARKSSFLMSYSKVQQDINRLPSSTSQLGATSSASSIPTLVQPPNCDFLVRRSQHISVRPSPAMLPEDFQGHIQGLHPVISKSSVIDIGRDMFKDSSIMMGSLGTIDEESNEALSGVHKRMPKGAHSSDSEGECTESDYNGKRGDKSKKVIDRSLSHSADLSEGEVPPRETRSHQ